MKKLNVEKHFCETYKRNKLTGKHIVSLPIKEEIWSADSYTLAKVFLEKLN